ncbi:helicase-associated domain-containing protein [Actinomadura barringtoniae]|uniref:Helicase-associated domain-containing protein n=1 Tax=Actinomadura barringtoniae TaxID=1427535 RepID=A0A939PPT0_9ACTN|nr:helicase-associated domain-containing protein [Actinomadura barringtoniae]MBO2455908.1 helicase-associated domain-containing protein [Actinomadura barringtoniae]
METYADWLRARGDDDLRALLSARPELIAPVPADLAALAARAATPAAISRALDRLDRFSLAAVEALLVLPRGTTTRALRTALGASARDTEAAVELLRRYGLVWGDGALNTAPGVRQALPHPAGLGPPVQEVFASYSLDRLTALVTDLQGEEPRGFADSGRLLARLAELLADPAPLIADAGPEARAALEQLAWGPPVGRVENARRPVRTETASTPIERLLARGLLAAEDDRTVTLPREVALHLRGGHLFRDVTAEPPTLSGSSWGDDPPDPSATAGPTPRASLSMSAGTARSEDMVVRAAAGEAFTAVRQIEELLERWGLESPPVLRSGGLAVRDLRAAAALLDVEEWRAALLIEVAYATGLLTRSGELDGEWLPTPAYDLWLLRDTAGRWSEVARGWLRSERVAGLAGDRDDRDRLINALSEGMVRGSAPATRRATLEVLGEAKAGTPADADAIRARLSWLRPRRTGRLRDQVVDWTLREAAVLGLTGFGALAPYARELLKGADPGPALEKHLPSPVEEILIQADLTAIAPGPLITELARELALCADVESTGAATVYRFTPESIRRALDAGRTAADVTDLLTRHSATPLPQPLTYLIDDVARRHGHLRVGSLASYVRTDNAATLDEILADRRSASLRLFRLAPTVLASALPRQELLETLRAMGLAPVAETPGGGVIVTRPDAHRADPPPSVEIVRLRPEETADDSMIAAAVRALRAGDEASRHGAEQARLRADAPAGDPPRSPAMATIEQLREAVDRGARVWIGYLDQQGQASSRIVEPVRVEGGFLTGFDATRAAVQRFALHRITGVAEVDPSGETGAAASE